MQYRGLIDLAPKNLTMLGKAVFYYAEKGSRQQALEFIDQYFSRSPRETGLGLSLGLWAESEQNLENAAHHYREA